MRVMDLFRPNQLIASNAMPMTPSNVAVDGLISIEQTSINLHFNTYFAGYNKTLDAEPFERNYARCYCSNHTS